jgi:predicted  nucleic acid-binding Zn-ribbon protein
MKESQSHFYTELGRVIKPNAKRIEPGLWFRELRILRKLESGTANEIRRVELRRGMNIIWAPPEESEKPELYGDGLSGHASGKTLFCRILRHLLGETNYGSDAQKDSVEDKFNHELWALAEVFVNGQLWLAARPLAGTSHRFAVKGTTIDEFLNGDTTRGDFKDFTDAIENTVCAPIIQSAGGNEQFRWRFLLPWLTRDQECRFADLTEWRSSFANSENPQTSALEQEELIQAALGLLDEKEVALREKLATAEDTIKEAHEQLPGLEKIEKRDYARLIDAVQRAGMENVTEQETVAQLKERKRLRADGLKLAIEQAEQDAALLAAKKNWEKAVADRNTIEGRIEQAKQTLEETTKKVAQRTSRYERMRAAGIDNPARMEQGFCPKTIQKAIERKCIEPPPGSSLETAANLGEILSGADELAQSQKEQAAALGTLQTKLNQLAQHVAATYQIYEREKQRIDTATADLRDLRSRLNTTTPLFDVAEESATAATEMRGKLTEAQKAKDTLKGEVEALRKAHEHAEKKLSDAFADAVRAAMGSKVEPTVTLKERFKLSVKKNGELSGAALETIKVIAFDLAAVVLSIEGQGHHPRFLIHDGPREADMARVIYERFFLYVHQKLEQLFPEPSEPNFQYIITTTTPPPKNMQEGSKWLRLRLNTAVTNERFLKEDF